MSSISSSTGCRMFRVSHHLHVPSVEDEKKSVPVFDWIQSARWTGSRWDLSGGENRVGIPPVRVSQIHTWPDCKPDKIWFGSFGLYSTQTAIEGGFRVSSGRAGFSTSQMYDSKVASG